MTASGGRSETRSSRKLEFTEDAELDLRSLLRYTNATWGPEQRDRYSDRLMGAVRDLLKHPHLGSARDDFAHGLRTLRVGQHVIFYRVFAQSIRVIRILHVKMDPLIHFKKPD